MDKPFIEVYTASRTLKNGAALDKAPTIMFETATNFKVNLTSK
jgi:hypothetical protein